MVQSVERDNNKIQKLKDSIGKIAQLIECEPESNIDLAGQ